jgi:hypothetical protein
MRTSDDEHDDKIVVRETAIGVFRRPPAAAQPAPSTWVEEETQEHEFVDDEPEPQSYEARRKTYDERMAYYTREFDRIRYGDFQTEAPEAAQPEPEPEPEPEPVRTAGISAMQQRTIGPPPTRPTPRRRGIPILSVVILLSVLGGLAAYAAVSGIATRTVADGARTRVVVPPPATDSAGAASAGASTGARPSVGTSQVASAPMDNQLERDFELVSNTGLVTIRASDLADRMYVITTPSDGNAKPSVTIRGSRVTLQLVPTGKSGPSSVEVRLNTKVRWFLRLSGGAVESHVDMSAGKLSGMELLGGATRLELSLPAPDGNISVRMSGGANQFLVHLPTGVPVRVRVGSGAANVNIDTLTRSRIAPGTVFTQTAWNNAAERYDIDAEAGFSTLRIDRR